MKSKETKCNNQRAYLTVRAMLDNSLNIGESYKGNGMPFSQEEKGAMAKLLELAEKEWGICQ